MGSHLKLENLCEKPLIEPEEWFDEKTCGRKYRDTTASFKVRYRYLFWSKSIILHVQYAYTTYVPTFLPCVLQACVADLCLTKTAKNVRSIWGNLAPVLQASRDGLTKFLNSGFSLAINSFFWSE